jgi:2-methylcitrate dehydratase PrpD
MSETLQLAQFATDLRYEDLPAAVVARAEELTLHAWGTQLAGSTLPLSRGVHRYALAQGGVPESTVIRDGLRTSAATAAFVNGSYGHGFEMDDNHAATAVKGGCVVVPTALAIGEQQGAGGKAFITALVAGYEVMTRVGLSVTPVLMQRGHHATGTCGPFGAAIAAGRLLGFDAATMVHAIGIAAGHAAGLVEAPASGRGDLKRIFGGMAAANGIRSAQLAQIGLTAPVTMLEGERGFCRAYGDAVRMPALTAGLGSTWQLLEMSYKVYAQDGFLQPMTAGLERIMTRNGLKGEDIAEVRVGASREAQYRVGVIREPKDLTSAQFSASFSLGLFLVKGAAGFQEYTEASLHDPAIHAMGRKVKLEVDDEIEQEFQRTRPRGARVTVTTRCGKAYSELVPRLHAMTADEVDAKFRRLATVAVSVERADAIIATTRALREVPDLRRVAPLLVA